MEDKSETNGVLMQPKLDENEWPQIDRANLIPLQFELYSVTVEDLAKHFSPDKTVRLDKDIAELISENLFDLF